MDMHPLRLHDRSRTPQEWTAHLSATQFAVFLRDADIRVALDPAGQPIPASTPAVCYCFESLADAETFCNLKIAACQRMLCEIYDRRGKAIDPIRVLTHPSRAHHLPNRRSAHRKILIAWLLLAIAPFFFWFDYRHDGALIFPTLVGFACFLTWARLLWWGHSELTIARQRETQVNESKQ
jgi:hypothetical protein